MGKGYSWGKDKKDKTKKALHMDGYHAGKAGESLGGLVWYEFFFHADARNLTWAPKGFTDERAQSMREIAHQTVMAAKMK